MPVLDHEVHEKVRITNDFRYGCHSMNCNVRKAGYYAFKRQYFPDGRFDVIMTYIKDNMSKECRYDLSLKDNACEGCHNRGSGEAYDQMIRSKS